MRRWIRSDVTLGDDPRTRKVARRLSVSIPTAVGHLHLLYWWAKSYAEDGDLSQRYPEDVAIGALWDGDADAFFKALVDAGYVVEDDDGARIMDWDVISGLAISKERSKAGRKGAQARWGSDGKAMAEPSGSDGKAMAEPSQSDNLPLAKNATGRDVTGRDETDETTPLSPDGDALPDLEPEERNEEEAAPVLAAFESSFWPRYPKRNGKKIGKGPALSVWKRMTAAERERALVAVEHYRDACDRDVTIARDAQRFLRDKELIDAFQTPATSNGRGKSPDVRDVNPGDWSSSERGERA